MANTLTTFNGLITEIPIWTRRNDADFLNEVPNFINLTQQAIFIDCPTMISQYYVTGNFTPNNNIISVPSLWGSNLTFSYIDPTSNNVVVLQYVSLEFIQNFNPIAGGISPNKVLPRYYSNYGLNNLIISPTPTVTNPFLLAFDTNNPPLQSSMQTNFISQKMFDLLFFGSLSLAYAFLENDSQFQKYDGLYQKRVQAYQQYNAGRKVDRNSNVQKD